MECMDIYGMCDRYGKYGYIWIDMGYMDRYGRSGIYVEIRNMDRIGRYGRYK